MDQQDTLADFLLDNNLISLLQPLTDQEADLDFLLQANDHELSLLVPGVVNKGKLRLALARYKELMLQEKPVHVTPPFRAGHLTSDSDLSTWTLETSETNLVDPGSNCSPGLPTTVDTAPPAAESSSTSRKPDTFLSPVIVSNASSGFNSPGITVIDTGCAEWEIADEIITSVDFFNTGSASLKTILENTSAGKPILSRTFLTTKDRKILTAIIVEAEIRKLKKISDPIRKEVWENWTTEIITLFPGETKAVYYSPFRILDGRVLQASGLIVNRLITVRRRLVPAENRRSRSRSSDDSSDSSTKKKARTSTEPVRVRPLPESFNSKKIGDQEESGESYLQWLKASSSPRDLVNSKWKNCLRGRIDILKESDHITYFKEFPALQCPWGYELLASDFDEIYPNTKEKFEEKFPILKGCLLALLDEKSQQLTRADISIQSVLELGTLGEEQANVAAFLSIPLLLKQMHTIPVKGTRKPWNPSRAEVSSAFLSLVASSSDVETHRLERQAKLIDKKEEDSAATEMCYKCCDSCKITLSFLVLILLFLTLIPWPGPSVFKITCSRDNSKIVRKVIQNKWLPVLERFQMKLPLECPFHPARDIFAPQHAAKLQHRPSQWTCAFCGKSFYEERHLDTHFDQRHKNQINKAEDAVCLADYCDIMRCQVLVAHGLLSGGGGPGTDVEVWQDLEAARKALAPAATRSVARVPQRRRPRPRADAPPAPPPPPRDCPSTDPRPDEPELEEKRTEDSDSDANQTAELCDADTVESSLPPDSRQKRLADLQAERAACDPTRLQGLKVRCERVVHSCIATLLLHLTQHQFTELEEEMQRAVCWYLSCDRYWEETAPSARAFPWPLLLALATGLALALCMCYYIIWIVFDSEEGSVAGSASVSMTTHSSPARGDRLAGDDALDDPDHDDHYIYVTYPPELKRRLLESCYNRTTRL